MLNKSYGVINISISAVNFVYNYFLKLLLQFLQSIPVLILFTFIIVGIEDRWFAIFNYYFGSFSKNSFFAIAFYVFYALFVFLILPFVFSRVVYKLSSKDLCLALPQRNFKTFFLIFLALSFVIPWTIYFAHLPEFQTYSFGHLGTTKFILMQLFLIPIYYIGEEFFFRGFLFNILWKKVKWHSFWITDILFTLSHIGKPVPEIILCIPVSIILNYMTLKTRSIYPAVLVHSSLGILLNTLITFISFPV